MQRRSTSGRRSTRVRARLARRGTSDVGPRRAARSRPLERGAGRLVADVCHGDEHVDVGSAASRDRGRPDVLDRHAVPPSACSIRRARHRRGHPASCCDHDAPLISTLSRYASSCLRALGPVSQAGAAGAGALGSGRVSAAPDVLHRSLQGAARAAGDADPDNRRRPRDRRGVGEATARARREGSPGRDRARPASAGRGRVLWTRPRCPATCATADRSRPPSTLRWATSADSTW